MPGSPRETHLHPLPPQPEKLDDPIPPPLATGKRIRRRARDVSSRYMATATSFSAPSSPIDRSFTSTSFRNRRLRSPNPRISSLPSSPEGTDSESEHSSHYADENQRSFETPLHPGVQCEAPNTLKRRVVRLFSDNTGDVPRTQIVERHKLAADSRFSQCRPRIGTPRPAICRQSQLRPTKKATTREEKSKTLTPFHLSNGLMAGNSTILDDSETESCRISSQGGLCHSPPIRAQGGSRKQALELRSSMPEADSLPTCSRRQAGAEHLVIRRSLNSSFSGCQPNPLNLMKAINRMPSADEVCNFGKFLPPQPLSSKLGLYPKKGKKKKEEDHALSLLSNQNMQWRFVNAKAEVVRKTMEIKAERSLPDVLEKLEELQDSVKNKRMELDKLKRLRSLSNIVNLEMPYLEEWALLEEEYSTSLSGAIRGLQDASSRLPVVKDVRVNVRELKDAVHSATRMFESFSLSLETFLPTADKIGKMSAELAKVTSMEKTLLEECEVVLSQMQELQIKECSLRSMLISASKEKQRQTPMCS